MLEANCFGNNKIGQGVYFTAQPIDLSMERMAWQSGWWDNRMAAQHPPQDLVRPRSGLKELLKQWIRNVIFVLPGLLLQLSRISAEFWNYCGRLLCQSHLILDGTTNDLQQITLNIIIFPNISLFACLRCLLDQSCVPSQSNQKSRFREKSWVMI